MKIDDLIETLKNKLILTLNAITSTSYTDSDLNAAQTAKILAETIEKLYDIKDREHNAK